MSLTWLNPEAEGRRNGPRIHREDFLPMLQIGDEQLIDPEKVTHIKYERATSVLAPIGASRKVGSSSIKLYFTGGTEAFFGGPLADELWKYFQQRVVAVISPES